MSFGRDMLYAAGAAASSPVWASRLLSTGKWRTDWLGRFGQVRGNLVNARNPRPLPHEHIEGAAGRTLLIHAVSVGEVNATRRLVAELQAADPALRIVIATTTDTGQRRARELFADHTVVRYPLDFTFAVRHFLDSVRPNAVALMELEVWPNFVSECERRAIPLCVVNGRLSERSFKRYRPLKRWLEPTFATLAAVGAQTEAYAERFKALGAPPQRVAVCDTMKWDTARVADEVEGADALAEALGIDRDRPLVVAGSTGPGEERMLINQCPPEAQLLLAPRKPERFEKVAALDANMVRRTQCGSGIENITSSLRERSASDSEPGEGEARRPLLFLLDTLGELTKAYALADVVVLGRSFNGQGGSDPIEPIALGKPVIVGPAHANFAAVVDAFREADGIIALQQGNQTGEAIRQLLADPQRARRIAARGRAAVEQHQGATRRYAAMIERLLGDTTVTSPMDG